MKMPSVGKLLISGVAAFTAVGAYLYDYNETHMFNPQWPPHAKFHDAQTISLGSCSAFSRCGRCGVHRSIKGRDCVSPPSSLACTTCPRRRACSSRTLRWSSLNLRQKCRRCSADHRAAGAGRDDVVVTSCSIRS